MRIETESETQKEIYISGFQKLRKSLDIYDVIVWLEFGLRKTFLSASAICIKLCGIFEEMEAKRPQEMVLSMKTTMTAAFT